ncbi:hypothetical protein OO184_21895 [Photorhabdus sp. APURE]|uniref:hypothetical protein n=1 Tax=Photorhabdus aballayi TaxID=2991723 RepID=UPI00223D23A6|nr:hypothetical protein [Photorhabdus aballayi]MCW7550506.1 hypothetical protein [Photorhabdus aballayi]
MKKIYLCALLLLASTFAFATKDVSFTMLCIWDELDKADDSKYQAITIYKENDHQYLEIAPTVKNNIPSPTYVMRTKGGYISNGKAKFYKDFYWMGNDTRLTLLRGDRIEIIIESISSPSMPVSIANCKDLKYNHIQ